MFKFHNSCSQEQLLVTWGSYYFEKFKETHVNFSTSEQKILVLKKLYY